MLNTRLNAHGGFTTAAVASPHVIAPEQGIQHLDRIVRFLNMDYKPKQVIHHHPAQATGAV